MPGALSRLQSMTSFSRLLRDSKQDNSQRPVADRQHPAIMEQPPSPPTPEHHPDIPAGKISSCPNPQRITNFKHTHSPLVARPPRQPLTPELRIRRFEANEAFPAPDMYRFALEGNPPFLFAEGQIIYTEQFGTTELMECNHSPKDWVEFLLIEDLGWYKRCHGSVLLQKEWCVTKAVEMEGGIEEGDTVQGRPNPIPVFTLTISPPS